MRSIPLDALVQVLACTWLPLLSFPAFMRSLIYALLWHSWLRLGAGDVLTACFGVEWRLFLFAFLGRSSPPSRKKECFQLNALDNKWWGAEVRLFLLELIVSRLWSWSSIHQESKPWSVFSNDTKKSNKRCCSFRTLLFIYVSAGLPEVQGSLVVRQVNHRIVWVGRDL